MEDCLEARFWLEIPKESIPRGFNLTGVVQQNLKRMRELLHALSPKEPEVRESEGKKYICKRQVISPDKLESLISLNGDTMSFRGIDIKVEAEGGKDLNEEFSGLVATLKRYMVEDFAPDRTGKKNRVSLKFDHKTSRYLLGVNDKERQYRLVLTTDEHSVSTFLLRMGYQESIYHSKKKILEIYEFIRDGISYNVRIEGMPIFGNAKVLEIKMKPTESGAELNMDRLYEFARELGIKNPHLARGNGGCRETLSYNMIVANQDTPK